MGTYDREKTGSLDLYLVTGKGSNVRRTRTYVCVRVRVCVVLGKRVFDS